MEGGADAKLTKQHQARKRVGGQNKSSNRRLQLQLQSHNANGAKAQDLQLTCNDTSKAPGKSNGRNIDRRSRRTDARLHSGTKAYSTAGSYTREPAKERAL